MMPPVKVALALVALIACRDCALHDVNHMKRPFLLILPTIGLLVAQAAAQNIQFDFENAPIHTPLPITLSVGGVTAQFSATGQGFSIQAANTMGLTPVGFSGNCIYPSSVYGSDLSVNFSAPMTAFSILYAPQELACDSSATMRVTAYLDGQMVGTATTNAQAGTWPSETLQISPAQNFNRIVVHYDKGPVTGGDWGPIFLADNMSVTLAPPPIVLSQMARLTNGTFQFAFANTPSSTFTVLATTNMALPIANWSNLGGVTEISPGQFQFSDSQPTNMSQRFYRISSP
jgi:hypothetical protein